MRYKPDGEIAENDEDYIDSWKELARPFCEEFGFELVKCNPCFSVQSDDGEFLQFSVNLMKKFYNNLTKKA